MGMDHNLYRTIGMGCLVYSYGDAMNNELKLHWGECSPSRIGTVYHSETGVTVGLHWNYVCTQSIRRYICGLEPPNYPLPAIPVDVLIMDWAIAVCEMNNPEYKYGIITLYPDSVK